MVCKTTLVFNFCPLVKLNNCAGANALFNLCLRVCATTWLISYEENLKLLTLNRVLNTLYNLSVIRFMDYYILSSSCIRIFGYFLSDIHISNFDS